MLNLLLGPVANIVSSSVQGFIDTKKAKQELKLTEIKATTKLKEDQIAGKVAWEASAVDQMKGSIKDEVALFVLLTPAVLSFIPGMTEYVKQGFIALQETPVYYQHLLYIAISASFGIKGASGAMKLFKKK
jgi:hypothetical protein|tara:strand:+ start:137 stop:529 length:393 start_codon:yes stop_codon:yes gene_type:complete